MIEPRNDDRSQARREAATLLGVDIDHLSPADGLRVDMVSALRLVIDAEQASVLSGGSADLGKLHVAVQSLIALLPGRELPAPESQREDPRQVLWRIIKEGRDRLAEGFEGYDGKVKQIEVLQAELAAKDAELAALKAGSAPAPPDVPIPVESAPAGGNVVAMPRPNPPAAPAAPAAKRQPTWDATPHGRAWRAWHDAGGPGFDRWSNRNGA